MKLYQRIIARGFVVGLAGLLGCDTLDKQEVERTKPTPSYFAELPMNHSSGTAMVSGDFDGDGDLDLIVGTPIYNGYYGVVRLYKLTNDGHGNFSQ